MKRSKLKKKLKIIKSMVFLLGLLIFSVLIVGINNSGKPRKSKSKEQALEETSTIIPSEFIIEAKDYKGGFSNNNRRELLGEEEANVARDNARSARSHTKADYGSGSASARSSSRQYSNTPQENTGVRYAEAPEIPSQYNASSDSGYAATGSVGRKRIIENALQSIRQSNNKRKELAEDYIQAGRASGIFVGEQSAAGGGLATGNKLVDSVGSSLANMLGNVGATQGGANAYSQQNEQQEKLDFLQKQSSPQNFSLTNEAENLGESLVVITGSIIPIVMVTAINSDLPGMISARVSEDVYDSLYGTEIIIPKGSMVVGSYDSSVSWGQKRLLVAWQRLVRPDGYAVQLEGMQGADNQGSSGLTGQVKTHIGNSIAASVLVSMFSLGVNYSSYQADTIDESKTLSSAVEATGSGVGNSIKNLANKFLNKQPTIYIKPGTQSNIFVNKDIYMPSFGVQEE